jgi:hypothetical protein
MRGSSAEDAELGDEPSFLVKWSIREAGSMVWSWRGARLVWPTG